MENNKPAVIVKDLHKSFRLPHEKHSGIKQLILNLLRGGKLGYTQQKVLKGVSFDIQEGDFFGIVGRNGSGKSTLLKLLAGIYAPNKGLVKVNGSLTPFIELGVGFNPELTGRENVYMNGALLGFSRKDMDEMYDDIVKFSELKKFMDQKLKNYSSGMQVRLAFSIAIKAQSDILLLDEVLAVGDEAFQRKCYAYFEDLKRDNKTVILVTHDMGAVERFCNKAVLIESGEIVEIGDPKIVAHAYKRLFQSSQQTGSNGDQHKRRWGTKELEITKIKVNEIDPDDKRIKVDLTVKSNTQVRGKVIIAYTVKSRDRRSLFGDGKEAVGISEVLIGDVVKYRLSFNNYLSIGDYYLDLSIRVENEVSYLDFWVDAVEFSVENGESNGLNILSDSTLERVR